jgi:hypothetical protein
MVVGGALRAEKLKDPPPPHPRASVTWYSKCARVFVAQKIAQCHVLVRAWYVHVYVQCTRVRTYVPEHVYLVHVYLYVHVCCMHVLLVGHYTVAILIVHRGEFVEPTLAMLPHTYMFRAFGDL